MRRARSAAVLGAAAALAAAAPAHAWVRTSDPDTGVAVQWPLPAVPWVLSDAPSFPSPGCAATAGGDPVVDAIRASFAEWERDCASLRLPYGGRISERRVGLGGTGENLVVVRQGWCATHPDAVQDPCYGDPDVDCGGIFGCFDDDGSTASRSIVALTTVVYDPATGRLFDADMEVNGWDGQAGSLSPPAHGYYFTCDTAAGRPSCTTYGQTGCNGFDLRNTVTHEVGHVIGLAHPCDDPGTPDCRTELPPWETVPYLERTMYPATSLGETRKRSLSDDELEAVCAVYPEAGGCGCGAGGAPGALALLLGALALRPALRRRARPRTPPPGAGRR